MYPALSATSSVAMANAGKMRGSSSAAAAAAAGPSKKSAVSKLLLKPTRLPKTSASSGVRGRDNLGFTPGPGRSESAATADMDMRRSSCSSPGPVPAPPILRSSTTSAGEVDPSSNYGVADDSEAICQDYGPRTRLSLSAAVAEGHSPISEEKFQMRRCDDDEVVHCQSTATFGRTIEDGGAYHRAGLLGAVRNEVPLAYALPLSKCGSTTALEALYSRRSESPIYEELDFKCSSFRDLNSQNLSRRLESPNVSDSSSEMSNPRRRGFPFPTRHFEHHGVTYSSPSCGVRIAEMRATRKYDGSRISPSTTTRPAMQHKDSTGPGIDGTPLQPSGHDSNDSSFRRSSSSQGQGRGGGRWQRGENHRSSLDLNVTYVEYFEEKRASPGAIRAASHQAPHICVSPLDALSLSSRSVSSLAETTTNRTSLSSPSSPPLDILKGHRETATSRSSLVVERDCQTTAEPRVAPHKLLETGTQTAGGPAKEKRQIRPIGFRASESRFTKSSVVRKPVATDKRPESGTGFLSGRWTESQKSVTEPTSEVDSCSRPMTTVAIVRRSVSEPDDRRRSSDDGSGVLSSPDTLIGSSEVSLAEEEEDDDDLASSSHHSTGAAAAAALRPSLGIRASQKRPQLLPSSCPPPPSAGRRIPPSQLLHAPPSTQPRLRPDPNQCPSPARSAKSSAHPMASSSASGLLPRQATTAAASQLSLAQPTPSITSPPTQPGIQRIENFGQIAESRNRVSVAEPMKLSKSTSSTDLNRNSSHLQMPVFRRNKPNTSPNTTGLTGDFISAPKMANLRPRIPPSPTPVRATVRRVQSSDSRPDPVVSSHSSTVVVGVSSTSNSKSVSKSVSTVKRESGSASIRTDDRPRVIGCRKDAQSSTAQSRCIASNAATNKLMRQNTVPEVSTKPVKANRRIPSASENFLTPVSLQQQQPLSPIAERSPKPRTSTSSGESLSGSVTGNCRGQDVSSRMVPPYSGANAIATQFYRNLSSSQRAASMSKISSAKSTPSSVTGGTSPKYDAVQQPIKSAALSTGLVFEDSSANTNEMSKSYSNIFEQTSAANENSPMTPLQRTAATSGRRLNTASCAALYVHHPEPHRTLQNKVSADCCPHLPQGTRNNENEIKSETRSNSSAPSSTDARKEAKPRGITEFSSRLRTPTDFSNGKKIDKSRDREICTSVCGSPRTSTTQAPSERCGESEAVSTPASVFKQLQLKHVKPYTSASNKGASIAEKFARNRSAVGGANVRVKMAASGERSSGTNCPDPKTSKGSSSNSGLSHAIPCTGSSAHPTGLDSVSLPSSNIVEQENRLDNLVSNSELCNSDHSPDDAIKTEASLSDNNRKIRQREDEVRSSHDVQELTSCTHSVSSFECAETLTSNHFKRDSYVRNGDVISENCASSNPPENTIPDPRETNSVSIAHTLECTDHTQVAQLLVSAPMAVDVSAPDPIQLSALSSEIMQVKAFNASESSHIPSEKSQPAESDGINADHITDSTISSTCTLSDTDPSSVQCSGDEPSTEFECFDSTTKRASDCDFATDFSERTLQRDCQGVSDSFDVQQQSDVTDAETLTDEDCLHTRSAVEITSQLSRDLSTTWKTEQLRKDHGSQTMLSDVSCLGDSRQLNRSNRNSLILQNRIIVDEDSPLRDIDKFVVTYESENIIVLERADSISCSTSLDLKDEFYDRKSARSDLPVSPTSTEIGQKWGKNSMSSSRSVDLRIVTSPKGGESGNLPLSESGYDSWKSQSSKSSMRFLKLSDGEAYAVMSAGSNLPEAVKRSGGLEGAYDRRSKDSELRRSGIQPRLGITAGYFDGSSSRVTMDAGEISSAASGKCGSVEKRLKCGSSGSESEVDVRHLGLRGFRDILSSTDVGREIDASCNYFLDDDDPVPLTKQDLFHTEEAGGGGGFSSSFSSFPSSNSSLMDTLESMSLDRSNSNEGFAEVWTATSSTRGPSTKLSLHPTEEKPLWSVGTDPSSDRPDDLACGEYCELSSNAAAFHSRDYHNRIYKLDFGVGDSGDLAIEPEDLDLGDQQDNPLLPSSAWMEEENVQLSGKKPEESAKSGLTHELLQSSENCSNSKSRPLQQSSRNFADQNIKHSLKPDSMHSCTFPLAVREVLTEGGMKEQEVEANAVGETCQLLTKLNSKSRRKQEKEASYENMCDELLESLEANFSDSDNTPSPTARSLEANSNELMCVGKGSNSVATTSQGKLVLHSKETSVIPFPIEGSVLDATIKRTHCLRHKQEPSSDAIHFQLIEGVQEKLTSAMSASEEQEKSRVAKAACEVLLPVSDKAVCQTLTTTFTRDPLTDSVPHAATILLQQSGLDSLLCKSNQGKPALSDCSVSILKELPGLSQQIPENTKAKQLIVHCKETSSPSNCNLTEISVKNGLSQRPHASSLATLPLVEPMGAISSTDCSPSDTVTTVMSKEEVKSGSPGSLLTRYFPGLLRRQSKDRQASPEIAERRSGRRHDVVSRNSAPVSYNRRSKDLTEQEPRSVRDVIRKFEDKTASQLAPMQIEGSKSSITTEKVDDNKGSFGKRSKFSLKPK